MTFSSIDQNLWNYMRADVRVLHQGVKRFLHIPSDGTLLSAWNGPPRTIYLFYPDRSPSCGVYYLPRHKYSNEL